ncbi:flagellar basal-body rod protein FlgG [Pyrinomonas methylaliphatogenes]|jgi:flagellar basal-body rod protein FlgG|uniref:Flagellar basal-body rod protein FlgG n=1 Tax=Pyrinomonas methylaliphatogenes TaxID=454194 RepID=A0A0B6WVY0_9BACT|nr:flagellar basal-body rod protein FlgG [Pyrinomonas methylaliphatogenes]MBX5477587.1 flagellar basal-body rod protein FlgG [Pyrinomonas methylaliphatogenes]CDM64907.1 flagellar basal-body rod protein FlgG [Pyrinomonas methylaliphatogenes]
MSRALHTAATGMMAQQQQIDNIANNLANSSTVGFKRTRLEFQDILYQNLRTPGAAANSQTTLPVGLQIGLGTRAIASERIFLQGDFQQTENPLDLVIEGSGFFQVRLASGEIAYTRAGSFHLNAEGQIVTATGEPLEPAITIPREATSINIGADGTVSVTMPGQANAQTVGQIQLATFANPAGLEAIGRNLFRETAASGQPTVGTPDSNGLGRINQGFVEGSNVNVVEELVQMIAAQRAYETNSKVITAADRMLATINQAVS